MPLFTCDGCGVEFKSRGTRKRSKRKYCNRACFFSSNPSTFDMAAWHRRNRAHQNAKSREWSAANPEKRKASRAKWQAANRERLAADARHRTTLRRASNEDMVSLLAAANGHCTYCGRLARVLEFDHIDPVKAGGTSIAGNLVPCCRSCNARKSAKDAADWVFDNFGVDGLARAITVVEQRRFEPALYPQKMVEAQYVGTKIVEVRA